MRTKATTQPQDAVINDGEFWITITRHRTKEVLVTLAPRDGDRCSHLRDVWFDGVSDEFETSGAFPRLLDGDGTRSIMSTALACSCVARFLVSMRARRTPPLVHAGTRMNLGPAPWDDLCDAVERLKRAHIAGRRPARDPTETPVETTVIVRAGLDGTPAMAGVEHHAKPTASALGHLVARALGDYLGETSLDDVRVREILGGEDTLIGPRVVKVEHARLAAAIDDWRDDPDVSHALATGRVALDWRLGECQGCEVDDDEMGPRCWRPKRPPGGPLTVAQLVAAIHAANPLWW